MDFTAPDSHNSFQLVRDSPQSLWRGRGNQRPVGRIVRAVGRWHDERLRGKFFAAALGVFTFCL